jgi:hypothetical protein
LQFGNLRSGFASVTKRSALVLALTFAATVGAASGASMGTLSGVVQDSAGAPVKNEVVILACWGGESKERHVLTDAKGAFTIQVPPGTCDVFFSNSQFEPVVRTVKVESAKKAFLKLELKARKAVPSATR